eukprot:scaffold7409_cov350-Prasinococcus_capsulatus_cf.AAC.3
MLPVREVEVVGGDLYQKLRATYALRVVHPTDMPLLNPGDPGALGGARCAREAHSPLPRVWLTLHGAPLAHLHITITLHGMEKNEEPRVSVKAFINLCHWNREVLPP